MTDEQQPLNDERHAHDAAEPDSSTVLELFGIDIGDLLSLCPEVAGPSE